MSLFKRFFRYLLNPSPEYAGSSGAAVGSYAADETEAPPIARARPRELFNLPLVIGGLILLALFLVILFGPLWARDNSYVTSLAVLPGYDAESGEFIRLPLRPSAEFLLGTDAWGNDMVSLLLYGARVTLIVGFLITGLRVLLGTILGSLAGWFKGRLIDQAVSGAIAVIASLPMLLSSMILILALDVQRGIPVFLIALTLIGWTQTAQFVRNELLVIREMGYIESAEAVGLNSLQMIVRHALPNLLPLLLVYSFLEMGAVLFLMAELGFLGIYIGGGTLFTMDPVFGRTAPLMEVPEWGVLLATGAPSLRSQPHLVWGPALAFAVAIFGLNATGEGLRRLLDKSAVSTGFLLRKRMLLVVAALALFTAVALNFTGPESAFRRVAAAFEGENAVAHATMLAQMDAAATAEYVVDFYREYELGRGANVGINSFHEFTPEGSDNPALFGFLSGFDTELSPELFVVFATYDPQSGGDAADAAGAATMLEMIRLWRTQKVNPRRSVLFVIWPSDGLDTAEAYLTNPENFTRLPIPRREGILDGPAAVFRLDTLGGGGDVLALSGDDPVRAIVANAAAAMGVDTADAPIDAPSISGDIPVVALQWQGETAGVDAASLKAAGETLSLALARMVRNETYE